MSRFVVIRDEQQGGERLIEESTVPTEASLHEVLMRHPSLVPATDLGLGRIVTVGLEASLSSGLADLVLLDAEGRICIIEVKKEGNPDTRRVIAQLLDYASALWGKTVEEFERAVLRHMATDDHARGLREFIVEKLVAETDDPQGAADRILEGLADTLSTGDFKLVLAAPIIPPSVQRVVEYLNARGLAVYGLEVSYFAGEVEVFVPRLVVRPRITDPTPPSAGPIDPEAYFASLPEAAQEPVRAFTAEVESLGGALDWAPYGPRICVRGNSGPRVIVSLYADALWLTVGPRKGLDRDCGDRAAQRLRQIRGVKVTDDQASVQWSTSSQAEIEASLAAARTLVEELASNAEGPAASS